MVWECFKNEDRNKQNFWMWNKKEIIQKKDQGQNGKTGYNRTEEKYGKTEMDGEPWLQDDPLWEDMCNEEVAEVVSWHTVS